MTYKYQELAQCGVCLLLREILASQEEHKLLTALGSKPQNQPTNQLKKPQKKKKY